MNMENFGRCKNCVQWNSSNGKVGSCQSPRWLLGYRVTDEEMMPDGVNLEDDEGWGMYSAPDFGCVHFIEK